MVSFLSLYDFFAAGQGRSQVRVAFLYGVQRETLLIVAAALSYAVLMGRCVKTVRVSADFARFA